MNKWFYAAMVSAIPPAFGFPMPVESAMFLSASLIIGSLAAAQEVK